MLTKHSKLRQNQVRLLFELSHRVSNLARSLKQFPLPSRFGTNENAGNAFSPLPATSPYSAPVHLHGTNLGNLAGGLCPDSVLLQTLIAQNDPSTFSTEIFFFNIFPLLIKLSLHIWTKTQTGDKPM